jgi:hypothetical protein
MVPGPPPIPGGTASERRGRRHERRAPREGGGRRGSPLAGQRLFSKVEGVFHKPETCVPACGLLWAEREAGDDSPDHATSSIGEASEVIRRTTSPVTVAGDDSHCV